MTAESDRRQPHAPQGTLGDRALARRGTLVRRRGVVALVPACVAALLPAAAWGHGTGSGHAAPASSASGAADASKGTNDAASKLAADARAYFTDTELVSHKGRSLRFFSDVLDGRVVLINVMFAQCKDACPLITQQLKTVRQRLGARVNEFQFVSITADPGNDSPQVLSRFMQEQGADEAGWTFLTGEPAKVEHVLRKLGQFTEDLQGHSTMLIAGNVPAKRWSKMRADAPAEAVAQRLVLMIDGGGAGAGPVTNTRR
jgi:protein SCO1